MRDTCGEGQREQNDGDYRTVADQRGDAAFASDPTIIGFKKNRCISNNLQHGKFFIA